jgi:hypothetical protein
VQALPGEPSGGAVLLDENHDCWPDLLCEIPEDLVQIWWNDGGGTFIESGRTITAPSLLGKSDQDVDGRTDVLVEFTTDSLGIYYGTPDGLSETPVPVSLALPGEPPPTFLGRMAEIVDLNCDGIGDVFAAGNISGGGAAEMRWRLGLGDRTFGEVHSHTGPGLSFYESFDVADLDADGDLEIALMFADMGGADTRFYTYNDDTNDMEYMGVAPDVGTPYFARMDGDQLWDLYLERCPILIILRGLGGIDFQFIQSVTGSDPQLGSVVFPPGKDLVCVSFDPPHWIHVHQNLAIPASIDGQGLRPGDQPLLSVSPSVASSSTRVFLAAPGLDAPSVQISDVVGRCVRTLPLRGGVASWDLRNESGRRVCSGPYWLSASIPGGRAITSKVIVVR